MRLEDHPTVKRYREKKQTTTPKTEDPLDSDWLKNMVLEAGADDAGLVEISRPELSDYRADIEEIFPRTRTLLSFIVRLNSENIRCPSQAVRDLEFIKTQKAADSIAGNVTRSLGNKGIAALNFACGFPMDLDKWPGKMWSIAHKPIAVAAGMGQMGLNRMVMHPRFGNFILLDTILIDRDATAYDTPVEYNPCIDCKLCAAVCPVGAIGNDGSFQFANCMTHNYRDRMGGFSDWVENIVSSKDIRTYRKKVTDPETVSMWQSLFCGISNRSSYCMAVCPAGDEYIGPYISDRKEYIKQIIKPLQKKEETIFVVSGSDAESHVAKRFSHKSIKCVGNGLRPNSIRNFFASLPVVFQKDQSAGLDTTYHFTFSGAEDFKATVIIQYKTLEVIEGHAGKPDLEVIADTHTWLKFLAKEQNLLGALLRRKIRIKGSPKLMRAFAKCFPA